MHYYYLHDVLARAEQVKAPPPNADFSHIELTERKGSDIMRTDARIIYNVRFQNSMWSWDRNNYLPRQQVTIEQMDTLKPVSCTLSRFGDPMQFYNFCDVVVSLLDYCVDSPSYLIANLFVQALYNRVNSVEATVSAPHNETDHEYDEEEHESEDEEEGETDVDNEDPEELDDHSKAVLEMMIFKEMVLQRFWD